MLELDAGDVVEFESFVSKGFLAHDDLHFVLSLKVDELVEDTIDASGLQKLPLVDCPEVLQTVFVLESFEKHL